MSEHINALSRRSFIGCAATAGAAIAFGAIAPTQAFGVTAAEKQAEAATMLNKLTIMQEKLDIASADYNTALMQQEEAQANMDAAQSRIDEANGQISDLQDQLGTRARSMYRSGSSSFIDLLLGATSFKSFTTNWGVLNSMNESDAEMVEETKSLRTEVEQQKAVYEQEEARAAEQASKAEQVKNEAEALVVEVEAMYNSLSAEAAQLLEEEEAARERERERRASNKSNISNNPSNVNNNKVPTVTGNVVVDRALAQLGKPYGWAGLGPDSFDCSGLVSYALSGVYGNRLGSTGTFMGWTQVTDPQPGDICTNDHHCGIYIGNNQMVHAPRTGDVVKVSTVHSGMIFVRY